MRVILTRHYRTISNSEGRILGWGNSPPSPGWRDDIEFVRQQLRVNEVGIDEVYSSDLERARQTAGTYAELFGVVDITATTQLREINYGSLQTREKSWVSNHYPQYKQDPAFVYPNGESFLQMQERSVQFLMALAQGQQNRTLLIVSHAGVIRGLISHCLGLSYAASLKHSIPFRYIGDFQFAGNSCVSYNELGDPSGFVRAGAIRIPATATSPTIL